uniref:restriction endonuclease subunit S n=1 Tax=Agathobacter rectalis TaxID=39491 RepID=UPI004025A5C2
MKVKIGDLTKIKTGKLDANVSSEDGKYPFFTCSKEPLKISTYSYDCECVLVAGNGDLNVKYYNGKFDAYQRTYIIEANGSGKLYMPYLYYFMEDYIDELRKQAIGGVIKYIKLANLTDALIELPSVDEQKSIVEILKKVKGILDKRNDEIRELDNLIKARFVEMFGDCTNMISLSDLCLIITDGTHQSPKFQHEGIPFILVSNLSKNTVTYDTDKFISAETYKELYKRTPIEIGDILLSTVGSYGHPAVVVEERKFLFQRHIAYLKPKSDILNSYYMHGALLSPGCQRQIEEKVKGIAQKTLNLSEIRKIRIPVPSLDLQKQYADFVHQVNKSKVAVQKALDETQILFDSLMQKYFG